MNLTTKSIVFNLLIFLFLTNILDAYSLNKNTYLKSKSNKKVLNLLADKFIEYFDLENNLIADNYFENAENKLINENEKWQNAEEINDYFFEVYSEENNKLNITADDLENLIMHQIQRRYISSWFIIWDFCLIILMIKDTQIMKLKWSQTLINARGSRYL